MHAPDAQPVGHVVLVLAYVHFPAAHVPDGAYAWSVLPSVHVAAGGETHVMPLHGSLPTHAPSLHPCAHTTS
jgi:hypothetical protein